MIGDARPVVYPPRSCGNLDGSTKAFYATRAAARRALRVHGERDGMRPYRCPTCDGYHVGHRRGAR